MFPSKLYTLGELYVFPILTGTAHVIPCIAAISVYVRSTQKRSSPGGRVVNIVFLGAGEKVDLAERKEAERLIPNGAG